MSGEAMMDATHPIWRTPAVRQAAAAGQFGALIRMTRTARQHTLVGLGRKVRYSASTLSRIETGQRKLTDVDELRLFANALGIPYHLFGLSSAPRPAADGAASPRPSPLAATVGETLREGGEEAMRRRQLLAGLVGVTGTALLGPAARAQASLQQRMGSVLPAAPTRVDKPVSVAVLRERLAAARATYQACRYHDLAATLPDVIAAAQASIADATGERHEHTAAVLADAYSLASDLCSRLHDDTLGWVTAERARSAAQLSGNTASIAEAARMTSIAMRRHGHHDTATTLLTTTALDLGADSGNPMPDLLATYGSLLCTASYTAAQNGDRHQAVELISEAETAAARLGHTRAPGNPFSAINVTIYQIGVHTALGDAGTALDHARTIDLRNIPTPERQARFCVDTARAWHRFGNTDKSLHALQVADRCAPEEVRRSSVRALLIILLDTPGPTPTGLRDFAARCGALA